MDTTRSPLLSAAGLLTTRDEVIVIDCSFDLADATAGERAWRASRITGALYWHLDRDLSDTKTPDPATGRDPRGRHPLPRRERWASTVGAAGITPASDVVVYDRQGGMFAGRAWWMLRWLGHARVQLLDGGLAAWVAAGGPVEPGQSPADAALPTPAPVYPLDRPSLAATVDAATLLADGSRRRVLDARAAERFRGEVEPLDPVAGHIPGAWNRPFQQNLQADGRFKSAEQLRSEWATLVDGTPGGPAALVHHCGSGVTACHNLIAQAVAGYGDAVLYPGSWSEWVADPARPVATGPT
jgi:thiosulfate/3-mercaptopyruvate sulfurtransferase